MVDARDGINASDDAIADMLRKLGKPVVLVVNKIDGIDSNTVTHDFYSLALGEPVPIAASHGRNVHELLGRIDELLPEQPDEIQEEDPGIAIAIVGRPNVGKSTLVNRLLGEERVVVFDEAGTTRDSIYIPFERDGKKFTLIDTAGMRRRSRVSLTVEKFSIIKSLQAIEKAHVVIYLIDAREGVTDQDAHILGLVLEAGRALIIGLNKWDGLNAEHRDFVKTNRNEAVVSGLCRKTSDFGLARQRRRQIVRCGAQPLRFGDGRHVHTVIDPNTDRCASRAPTAAGRRSPDQIEICPPGRPQPAGGSDSRRANRRPARRLQALFDELLPRSTPLERHAGTLGIQIAGKSISRPKTSSANAKLKA